MAGLGKQLRGVRIARVLKAEGGSIKGVEDMSSMHEAMEPEIEEARETKLEKKGYRETKAGKMVKDAAKDAAKGFKEGVKKLVKTPFDAAEKIVKRLDKAKGGQAKVSKVMKEFGKGKLHSGKKGPVVKSRKQAIAIALSEAGKSKKK